MGRWAPDAHGRLGQAALELFQERGYDQTTAADIAARAGLTARTFFRYFADKREVLFSGSEQLAEHVAESVRTAEPDAAPMAVVAGALHAAATLIGGDREFSRRRQAVIAANPELQERELTKLNAWARLLQEGLVERGVDPLQAAVSAQAGVAVFHVAFQQWLAEDTPKLLPTVLEKCFAQLPVAAG